MNTNQIILKKRGTLLIAYVVFIMAFSCGNSFTTETDEALKEKMHGTWHARKVTVDHADVTADFSLLTLTINGSMEFTSNGRDLRHNPWPSIGFFEILTLNAETGGVWLARHDNQIVEARMNRKGDQLILSVDFSEGRSERTWTFYFAK